MTEKKDNNKLGGLFIFNDEKTGQTVFFDIIRKKGYVITDSKKQKYAMYTTRYLLEVTLSILLCTSLKIKAIYGVGIFVIAFLIGELFFRYNFLYKQPELKQFVKKDREFILVRIAKDVSMKRAVLIVGLSLILTVAGIVNIYVTTYNPYGTVMFLFECCVGAAGAFIAVIYSIVIIIKLIKKY